MSLAWGEKFDIQNQEKQTNKRYDIAGLNSSEKHCHTLSRIYLQAKIGTTQEFYFLCKEKFMARFNFCHFLLNYFAEECGLRQTQRISEFATAHDCVAKKQSVRTSRYKANNRRVNPSNYSKKWSLFDNLKKWAAAIQIVTQKQVVKHCA